MGLGEEQSLFFMVKLSIRPLEFPFDSVSRLHCAFRAFFSLPLCSVHIHIFVHSGFLVFFYRGVFCNVRILCSSCPEHASLDLSRLFPLLVGTLEG